MTTELVPVGQPEDRVGLLVNRVLAATTSPETRRAYGHALERFLAFCAGEGNPPLTVDLVMRYRAALEGKSSSTAGVHLAAIKALARAAMMAGFLPPEIASSINDVKGPARRGNRIGNWLTQAQARELLLLPDRETLKGKRDHAILAVLLGLGLRRAELVSDEVKVGAIVEREGRWVLADITGKGNSGSLGGNTDLGQAGDRRLDRGGQHLGREHFPRHPQGRGVWGEGLTPGAVLQVVQGYMGEMGIEKLAPHDMRRTCAKLCRKRGGVWNRSNFSLATHLFRPRSGTWGRSRISCLPSMTTSDLRANKVSAVSSLDTHFGCF